MKRLLALLLACVLLLSLFAGCKNPGNETTEPTVDDGICETAQECVDNITVGWNLGCSLSAFASEDIDAWGVMAYFLTPDKLYSRSEVTFFDPETKTAEISWILGKDGGVMQVYEGALMDGIGIELWNFALGESDILTYNLDELNYVTADGEVVVTDCLGEKTTDMGGGTGGGIVLDLDEPAVADIQEIHAKITFVEQSKGESTPESIAAAEMSWGNPVTTQEMIDKVAERGFNFIRVQVSYLNHMDEEGNIDPLWLDRVAEVVDYCMNANVYCLINTTGAGWLTADPDTFPEQSKIYRRLWEQISERFADYGELLLFESCNEVLTSRNEWWNPPAESYDVMNELYQIFVDTVRAGGGYNETRNLVLNPYAAQYDYHMNQGFKLPTDTVEGHLIAQVHCYDPNSFCFNETNLGSTNFTNSWGTDADKRKLDELMKNIKKRFVEELGIPVIVGEFGTVNRVVEDERAEYVGYYAKAADANGIKVVIFDDGGDFTVFDRTTMIWPYPKIIDALFNKDAPAFDVPEEKVDLDEDVEGWGVVLYFSGTDGSYNRSAEVKFDPETQMAEIVWKLGKDDGIVSAKSNAGIDGIGAEIWNFDKGASDFVKYDVQELKLITKDGERIIEDGLGTKTSDMSGGTGGGLVADLMDNPSLVNVTEIHAKIKMLGSYFKDMGPAKEALPIPDSVPPVSNVSNPLSGWSAKIYMSASDFSYSTSAATYFDANTKTAKIVWILGQDGGVYTAAPSAGIDILGVDIWNFDLDEKTTINYWIKDLKYYTTKDAVDVPVLQDSFRTDMSGGTGGGTVADLDAPALSNIVAIYMEVKIDGKPTGGGGGGASGGSDVPASTVSTKTVSSLPTVKETANPLENYQTVLYLATLQTGFNRSDPAVSFDKNTMAAEVLWKFDEGRAGGFITAGKSEAMAVLGAQIYNFEEKPTGIKYTVESLKYYTASGSGYKECTVNLNQKNFTTSLAGSGANGGPITSLASPPAVGDVVAVYAKIKLDISNAAEAPKPVRPDHSEEGLPTVATAANPLITGVRLTLATKQTSYNVSEWSKIDADTKKAEVLWMFNDPSVTAANEEILSVLNVELANWEDKQPNVKIKIDALQYYTDKNGTCVPTKLSFPKGTLTYDLSKSGTDGYPAGMDNTPIINLGDNGPKIGDVVAVYLKITLVSGGGSSAGGGGGSTQPVEPPKTVAALPTVTPAADPLSTGARLSLRSPAYLVSGGGTQYMNFDSTTKISEVLWDLTGTDMDAHAAANLTDIWIELADYNNKPSQVKLKVEAVKYYQKIKGGYQEVSVPITNATPTLNLSSGADGKNVATPASTVKLGDIDALYVKLTLLSDLPGQPSQPVDPPTTVTELPTVTPAADPLSTGARLSLISPTYLVSSPTQYMSFDSTTKISEVLWDLTGTDMDAHAAANLGDIWIELLDDSKPSEVKIKVEAVKYYKEIQGGYEEVSVPITNATPTLNLSTGTEGKNIATPASTVKLGDIAALYVKLSIEADEPDQPDQPDQPDDPNAPVQLPTITPAASPMYTGARLSLRSPAYLVSGGGTQYMNFDSTTKISEVLWDLTGTDMDAHAAADLADIWVELADYTNKPSEVKIKVEAVKYYKEIQGGYEEVEVPITNATPTLNLSGGADGVAIATPASTVKLGDIAALYVKLSIEVDEPDQPDQPDNPNAPVQLPTITPAASPMYTGARLSLRSPAYLVSGGGTQYMNFDSTTKISEVLWDLTGTDMDAHAAADLADIWVELADYTNKPSEVKIKVEAVKYYKEIQGGYEEVSVPITNATPTLNLSGGADGVAIATPASTVKLGDIAALYVKLSIEVDEPDQQPDTPSGFVTALPTPATADGKIFTEARMFVRTPAYMTSSAAYTKFDSVSKSAQILWNWEDSYMEDYISANGTQDIGKIELEIGDGMHPDELKFKVESLKYYVATTGGYDVYDLDITTANHTVDLSGPAPASVVVGETKVPVKVNQIAAIYMEVSLVVDLPTVNPNPTGASEYGTRIVLKDIEKSSGFSKFDTATNTAEVLWDLTDGSMDAHAAAALQNIYVELADSTKPAEIRKVKVEALRYYQAVEGGYKEIVVPITTAEHDMDLSATGVAEGKIGSPAASVKIGDIAAIYMKVSIEIEESVIIVPTLPSVEANPAGGLYDVRIYFTNPSKSSSASKFDPTTKTAKILWDWTDGSMDLYAAEVLKEISVQLEDFSYPEKIVNFRVDEVKYYKYAEGGYQEITMPLQETNFAADLYEFGMGGGSVGRPEVDTLIGDVAAIYMEVSLVED